VFDAVTSCDNAEYAGALMDALEDYMDSWETSSGSGYDEWGPRNVFNCDTLGAGTSTNGTALVGECDTSGDFCSYNQFSDREGYSVTGDGLRDDNDIAMVCSNGTWECATRNGSGFCTTL
jgi:hypothetical protein